MSVPRKNTLVVDFSVLPKRPDAGKVQQFLEKKVKLQLADSKTIQLHNLRNLVYIETIDTETALRYEKAHNYKHSFVCNNEEFKIPVYVESEAVTVRVHDLPSHTEQMTIVNFMKQYGDVISIRRERWKHHFPGHYNGVRVLRMTLSRPIPSCVTIDGETTLVTYRNQPKTCHHCGKAVHPKQKCTSNSKTSPLAGPAVTETNDEVEIQNENNTTSKNGDDCGDGNDYGDDDDNDDDGNDDDDDNGSSDNSDFFEPSSYKRRMSKRAINQKANENKKVCVSQGNQNNNCNRFQALIELGSMSVSDIEIEAEIEAEMEKYTNRLKGCSKKK